MRELLQLSYQIITSIIDVLEVFLRLIGFHTSLLWVIIANLLY